MKIDHLNINPVSQTALVALEYLRKTDLPYAEDFAILFDLDNVLCTVQKLPEYKARMQSYTPRIEARLKGTDILIRDEGNDNILDLACGFTPRCVYMATEGYNYVGADLPFVIHQVKPAVTAFIDGREDIKEYSSKIKYVVADVTDYNALEKAVAHMSGAITVTCEGLLFYMPAYEQKEVAKNIHALLSKHGGVWITSDFDAKYCAEINTISNLVFAGATEKEISDKAVNNYQQAYQMLEEVGFEISEKIYSPKMEEISSLSHYNEAEQEELYQFNKQWNYLVLRCK